MKIINKTNGDILATRAITANSVFKRMRGLLGRKDLVSGEAMILPGCNCVHTLFMSFPIDVVFVDKDQKVVRSLSSLKPFCFSPLCWKASSVIELPAGTIQESRLHPGDLLILE